MCRVHLVAIGSHQQQALHLLTEHQIDEADSNGPGPLQVVDEQHHRPFARGHTPQHVHSAVLHPHLGGQRIARLRGHAQQRRQLRHRGGSQARIRTQCRQHPFPQLDQLVLGLREQQPTQRTKRLKNAARLQIPPILVELARHKPAIVAGYHRA